MKQYFPQRSYGVVMRKGKFLSAEARAFIDLIRPGLLTHRDYDESGPFGALSVGPSAIRPRASRAEADTWPYGSSDVAVLALERRVERTQAAQVGLHVVAGVEQRADHRWSCPDS